MSFAGNHSTTEILEHIQATLWLLRMSVAVLPTRLTRERQCQEYAVLRMRECEDYLRQWVEVRALEDIQGGDKRRTDR